MQLIGNRLVIPLFNTELSQKNSYKLGEGISLFTLTDDYEEMRRATPELIARYENSLSYMKSGLSIERDKLINGKTLIFRKLLELGIFIAMSIRLATRIPIDTPYWFDVDGDEIKRCGNTLLRTYRSGNRYPYPLDNGKQSSGLFALQEGISDIAQKHVLDLYKNVLIRAIQFVVIGFQTRYVLSRLVNNTIFLESLFCCTNVEISFQIASSISWYLKSDAADEERLELFSKIKKLYGYRSKIVHGSDISSKSQKLKESLLFSEELNMEIFQNILTKKHIDVFSMKQEKRREELKSLTLGADCVLLGTNA